MPLSHFGPIPTLIVDLAPVCDLACVMCPQGRGGRGVRRAMDASTVDAVVAGLAAHRPGAHVILPFWNGEPLVAPSFDRFVDRLAAERARGLRFESLSLHTNATHLTPERSARIVSSGLFSPLTFSLDAATPETYAAIRRGGDFEAVTANVRAFLETRRRLGAPGPYAVLQFIAMEANLAEAAPFARFWRTELDRLGFPHATIFDDTGVSFDRDMIFIRKLIPDEESPAALARVERLHAEARRAVEGENTGAPPPPPPLEGHGPSGPPGSPSASSPPTVRRPCPGIFAHLGVAWDGGVSPCCRDFECRMKLGNARETALAALWTGGLLRDWRIAHVEGRFADVPRCGECPGQPFGAITDAQVVEWLKSVGEERRIHPYLERVGAL